MQDSDRQVISRRMQDSDEQVTQARNVVIQISSAPASATMMYSSFLQNAGAATYTRRCRQSLQSGAFNL
jgi:hypothetical protein